MTKPENTGNWQSRDTADTTDAYWDGRREGAAEVHRLFGLLWMIGCIVITILLLWAGLSHGQNQYQKGRLDERLSLSRSETKS